MKRYIYSCMVTFLIASFAIAEPVQWSINAGGNGHWYEPVLEGRHVSWSEAKIDAENKGGYLATITSDEENIFVFNLISDISLWSDDGGPAYVGPWIGGYQPSGSAEPDGGWSWITGELWTYSNWDIGQPSNAGDLGSPEDHLHYYSVYSVPAPTWNDCRDLAFEDSSISYVVEYVPEPASLLLLGLGGLILRKRKV